MKKQPSLSSEGGTSKKRRLTGSLSLEEAPLEEPKKKNETSKSGATTASASQKRRRTNTASEENNAAPDSQIQQHVFDSGLARPTKAETYSRLDTSKALKTCSGYDIVRKGTQRKSKYLLSLPMNMIVKHGGKIGELADMDTKNPTLLVDLPKGKLKLTGHIVHTSTRFITLQCYPNRTNSRNVDTTEPVVSCEDVFDKMIVFSGVSFLDHNEPQTIPDELRKTADDIIGGEKFVKYNGTGRAVTQKSEHKPARAADDEGNTTGDKRRHRHTPARSYNEQETTAAAAESDGGVSEDSGGEATVTDVTINRQNTLTNPTEESNSPSK
eukprot:gb/GECG01002761.1/.p1 GENE.gb/GECG01002761.1/~~gb/GECG01002761.1/.p1  ORF type:complete len:326 (+),score=61.84 gb/GECG01002761.1/:1-978(+)